MNLSFAQSSYDQGNYLFCRIKQDIFIISYNDQSLIYTLTENEMEQSSVSLIPYQDKNNNKYLIICYIDTDKKLCIKKFSLNSDNQFTLINKVTKLIEYEEGTNECSLNYAISCELIFFRFY